jgi:hypothetical protein
MSFAFASFNIKNQTLSLVNLSHLFGIGVVVGLARVS